MLYGLHGAPQPVHSLQAKWICNFLQLSSTRTLSYKELSYYLSISLIAPLRIYLPIISSLLYYVISTYALFPSQVIAWRIEDQSKGLFFHCSNEHEGVLSINMSDLHLGSSMSETPKALLVLELHDMWCKAQQIMRFASKS
mgnify:FL=1